MRVFCVEDDRGTQELFVKLIEKLSPGTNVEIQDSLSSAILLWRLSRPDLFILDWNLPDFCMSEGIEYLIKSNKPIIIFTAVDYAEVKSKVIEKLGAVPYGVYIVQKTDMEQLKQLLCEFLP